MPRPLRLAPALALLTVTVGCAGTALRGPDDGYSRQSWATLATPRPVPVAGAPGIAVDRVDGARGVLESVGMAELILLRFLHRDDVWMIDRRRYSLAAARSRRGLPRPPEAPPLGSPPRLDFTVRTTVAPPGPEGRALLSVQLVEAASERVRATWRDSVPADASTVALARAAGSLLEDGLAAEGLLAGPGAGDPEVPTGRGWSAASIQSPEDAFRAFMEGVVAEDRYNWRSARAAYARARSLGGPTFVEPLAALSRVARLRAGGTLGAS